MLDLENCAEIENPHTLIFFEDIERGVTYLQILKLMEENNLDAVCAITEDNGEYFIKEYRNREEISKVEADLKTYKKDKPRNWILLRDVVREHKPEILKEMREYHENVSMCL